MMQLSTVIDALRNALLSLLAPLSPTLPNSHKYDISCPMAPCQRPSHVQ